MNLLTVARDLRRRKGRERRGRFVAEGVRTVEALLESPVEVDGILHTEALAQDPRGERLLSAASRQGIPTHEVTGSELGSAADTETPQGILAVARVPSFSLPEPAPGFRLLILDAIQDPGNAGTIVRSAAALGVTHTIALPGTVDLWSAKVVRSAMGASFTHPTSRSEWSEVESWLRSHGIPLWVSDTRGEPLDSIGKVPDRLALAVGNEGAGLGYGLRAFAGRVVSIPMSSGIESLNVSVATGIILYALSANRS